MTKAGLDPSRLRERAEIVAKVQGMKRKRGTEEGMDVDMEDGDEAPDAEGWMDVDDEEATTPVKRMKGNAGGAVAVNRRAAKTDRQAAGMRDEEVCLSFLLYRSLPLTVVLFYSKPQKLSNCGTWANDRATCLPEPEKEIARSQPKW